MLELNEKFIEFHDKEIKGSVEKLKTFIDIAGITGIEKSFEKISELSYKEGYIQGIKKAIGE